MPKQVFIAPYAPHSSPTLNRRAYTVECEVKTRAEWPHGYKTVFRVWSPVHYPHFVGRFQTEARAQKKADKINLLAPFIYGEWPPES